MDPATRGTHVARLLDGLQVVVAGVAVFLAVRGEVNHTLLFLLWGLLPIVRALASRTYRRRWRDRMVRSGEQLAECSTGEGRLPWRAAFLWVGLPVMVLALANGRKTSSYDNLPTNLMAASIVLEGDAELSEYAFGAEGAERSASPEVLPYSITRTETGVRSVYPWGNLLFAVPVFAVAHLVDGDIARGTTQWRLTRGIATLLAAGGTVLFLFIALQLAEPRPALLASLMFGLGSSMLSTLSQGLWSQTGATFLILVVLLLEFRREVPGSWIASHPIGSGAVQCLALGCLFATRLTSATFLLPFGLWLLLRDPRRAIYVTLGALATYAPWAALYWASYGSLLGPQFLFFREAGHWSDHFGMCLAGLLVSPARGFLVYQPWLLLPLALLWPAWRSERTVPRSLGPRGWPWLCLSAVFLHLALVSTWGMWWGGHSWGSRLLAETMPCAALLMVPVVSRLVVSRNGHRLVVAATLLGFLMQANQVLGPGRKWNDVPLRKGETVEERMWDWHDPPFLYPLPRWL